MQLFEISAWLSHLVHYMHQQRPDESCGLSTAGLSNTYDVSATEGYGNSLETVVINTNLRCAQSHWNLIFLLSTANSTTVYVNWNLSRIPQYEFMRKIIDAWVHRRILCMHAFFHKFILWTVHGISWNLSKNSKWISAEEVSLKVQWLRWVFFYSTWHFYQPLVQTWTFFKHPSPQYTATGSSFITKIPFKLAQLMNALYWYDIHSR